MNSKTLLGAFGLVAVLGASGLAMAQDSSAEPPAPDAMGPGMGPQMGPKMGLGGMPMFLFETIDVNGDGQITKEEVLAFRQSRIAGLDADKDGKITAEELSARMMQNMAPMIEQRATGMVARFDIDGDGALSVEELAAGPMMVGPMRGGMDGMMFERFDGNGDGAITREEATAAMADMDQPGRGPGGRHGHHGQGWGEWMRGWGGND